MLLSTPPPPPLVEAHHCPSLAGEHNQVFQLMCLRHLLVACFNGGGSPFFFPTMSQNVEMVKD